MDDIRAGRVLRALRIRRGLTQAQLGARAGLAQPTVSLVERGHSSMLSGATLRRLFAVVDARWEPAVSWRGGDIDRLLDAAHAALAAETVRRLRSAGWQVVVEATYSSYGERGSIDVLAGRASDRALLVIEVKSEITALEAMLRKVDEKERIGTRVLAPERFGFSPRIVGRLLVLPATTAARRRVAQSAEVLNIAFPARGTAVRQWIRRPAGNRRRHPVSCG